MKYSSFTYLFSCNVILFLFSYNVSLAQNTAKFTENKGQWHPNIEYRLKLWGGDMFLEKNRFVFQFMEEAFYNHSHAHNQETPTQSSYIGQAYYVNFVNGNANPTFVEENAFADLSHYYYGNDPSKWAENVKGFADISYQNVWQGVDAHVYSKEGNVKYDFIVHANSGNANQIQLHYEGIAANDMTIDTDGKLKIHTNVRDVTELKPLAYQWLNGQKVAIACDFVLDNAQNVSFQLGANYDPTLDLVIDPTLIFSTYTGSTQDNWGFTATYDNSGNAFGGGIVWNIANYPIGSTGYPTTAGVIQTSFNGGDRDAAITKYNPAGTGVIFSTYLGGSGEENPQSMVANSAGELVVLGRTNSLNFPVTANAYDNTINGGYDFYLAKFSPTGTMQVCTFVGGAGTDGMNGILVSLPEQYIEDYLNYNYSDDARGEVIVDNLNNVYVSGTTSSADFPVSVGCFQDTLNGARDAVVFKMNPSLSSLTWATFYGGSDIDAGYGIKVDNNYNVFFTGGTRSLNLPTTAGAYQTIAPGGLTDGYLAKLNSTGTSLLSATYVGTGNTDQSYFVEIDASQNIYITGQTLGAYPIVNATYSVPNARQFITKFDNNLAAIIYSTTFGSSTASSKVNISPTAFLVDICENVYVAGWGGAIQNYSPGGNTFTGSAGGTTYNMPLTANALQSTTDGSDFYIFVMDANATGLLYGTYFGGSSSQEHVDGGTSRFDPSGVIYEAVCASCGGFDPITGGFPTTPGVWSPTNNSPNCNLGVFKIDLGFVATASAISAPDSACVNTPVVFVNNSTGATTYTWDFGDGSPLSYVANPVHTYTTAGTYTISLIANPPTTICFSPDTTQVQIVILPAPVPNFTYPASVCLHDTVSISYNGAAAATYTWDFGGGVIIAPGNGTGPGPHSVQINGNTTISINITSPFGCKSDTITHNIAVIPLPTSDFTITDTVCVGHNAVVTYTGNAPASATYSWNFGGGNASPGGYSQGPQNVNWNTPGVHTVSLVVELLSGCKSPPTFHDTYVYPAPIIALALPDSACANQVVTAVYTGSTAAGTIYHWDFGGASGGIPNTASPQNLSWSNAGTYTISVWIDAGFGCQSDTAFQTIVIHQIPTSPFTASAALCFGGTATVSYTGNATPNATYAWSLGGLTATPTPPTQNFVLSGFPNPGTYPISLIVTENNCTGTATNANIIINPIPVADFVLDDSACITVPVTVTYTGSVGIPNLLYHWNLGNAVGGNPNGIGPQNIFWNTPGTQTVCLWTEANGCISDTICKNIYVKQGPPPPITVAPSDICISDTTQVFFAGIQDPSYSYSWNFDGGIVNPGTGPGPHTVYWLIPGIKNITLTLYINGCPSKADTANVHVFAPPIADFAYPDSVCMYDPNQVVFTGVGTINGIYNWNFGSATVLSGTGMGSYTLSWATPGTHSICVQLTEPVCPPSATVCHNFTILDQPIASINPVANQCFTGNSFDFSYTGTGNPDSYYWGFPGGFPASSPLPNPTGIHYFSPGIYTAWVYVTKDGCVSDTVHITYEVIPEPDANFTYAPGPFCVGSCINYTFTGTTNYPQQSYSWNFGTNAAPQFSTLPNVSCGIFTAPGNHYVSLVVNNRGCIDSVHAIIPIAPSPIVNVGTDIHFCQGTAPISLNAMVAGGTTPYYYTWTDIPVGLGGISNPYILNPTVNPATPTQYILHVQDGTGCVSNYDTVKVTPIPTPKINAGPDMKICSGLGNNGVQLQGGLLPGYAQYGPYHYSWTPFIGMSLGQDTLANPLVNPTSTTVYTLTATSFYGCKSDPLDSAATVTVDVIPIPTVDAGPYQEICKGDTVQLLGTVQGTGNYTIAWTSALPNGGIWNTSNPSSLATPAYTHTYMLVAGAYGCYGSDTVTVFVHTLPTAAIYPPSTSICQGDSILLHGLADGDPFGTVYTYHWTPNSYIQNDNAATTYVYPHSTTTYNLEVGSANCKGFADAITITVLPTPITTITNNDTTICLGDSVLLNLNYSFSGTPVGSPIFYEWQPNLSSTQSTWVHPTQTTVYTATARVGACRTTDKVNIFVAPIPHAQIVADTTVICANHNANLSANGGFPTSTYSWTPTATINAPTSQSTGVHPSSPTTYYVWISQGLCVDSASIRINTLPQPTADYTFTNAKGCAPLEVQFIENASDALSYIWNFGDNSPNENLPIVSHTYNQAGTYPVSLTVIGQNGCDDEVMLSPVVVSPAPIANFTSNPSNDSTIMLPNGFVQFTDLSEHAATWLWSFGDGAIDIRPNPEHNYQLAGNFSVSLLITNDFGCTAEISKNFTVIPPATFIPNTFTPNGDGIHDEFVLDYDGTEKYHLEIYDRWGVKYFIADSPVDHWKGTRLNGEQAKEGVYFYSLRIGKKVFSGNVMVLR